MQDDPNNGAGFDQNRQPRRLLPLEVQELLKNGPRRMRRPVQFDAAAAFAVTPTVGGVPVALAGQTLEVQLAGVLVGTRGRLNLIAGSNVTLTVADNAGQGRVDVTINASLAGGTVSGAGTLNRIARFTGASSIGDAGISDDGATVAVLAGRALSVAGTTALGGAVTSSADITVTGATALAYRLTRGTVQGLWQNGVSATYFGALSNHDLRLVVNNVERAVFWPSGGISLLDATDPGAGAVRVNGVLTAIGNLVVQGSTTTINSANIYLGSTPSHAVFVAGGLTCDALTVGSDFTTTFGGAVDVDGNFNANGGIVAAGFVTLTSGIFTGNGSGLTTLNASNLASGTVPDARFPATLPAASGANLTALNASNLTTGTLANARVVVGNVTQHQAALSIAWSQLTGVSSASPTFAGVTVTGAMGVSGTSTLAGLTATNFTASGDANFQALLTAQTRFRMRRSSGSLDLTVANYWNGSGSPSSGTIGDIFAIGNAGGDGLALYNSDTVRQRFYASGGISLLDQTDPGAGAVRVAGSLAVTNGITLDTNATYVRARTTGGTVVSLLGLTADASNITRFRAGVDAGGFQWTDQAQSVAWMALAASRLSILTAATITGTATFDSPGTAARFRNTAGADASDDLGIYRSGSRWFLSGWGTGAGLQLNTSTGDVSVSGNLDLPPSFGIRHDEGSGNAYTGIFRQTSSAALVLGSGVRRSATANGFASSTAVSWGRSAVLLGSGTISFWRAAATITAVGTDVTLTEAGRFHASGGISLNTTNDPGSDRTWIGGGLTVGDAAGSYRLFVTANSATNADILLAGMVGVTNGVTYRRVSGTFEFRVASGNVIVDSGFFSGSGAGLTNIPFDALTVGSAVARDVLQISGGVPTWAPPPLFSATERGAVPLSGGGTSNFLRADGVWTTPTVGTVSASAVTAGTFGGGSYIFSNAVRFDSGLRLIDNDYIYRWDGSSALAGIRYNTSISRWESAERWSAASLGTGTASSATYLRGDGVWSAPPANVWTTSSLSTDQTKTSDTTFAALFSFSAASGATYAIRAVLHVRSVNATADLALRFTGPSSPTLVRINARTMTGTVAGTARATAFSSTLSILSTAAEEYFVQIDALVQNGANAGTIALEWAQNTSSADSTTVYAGSHLEYFQL